MANKISTFIKKHKIVPVIAVLILGIGLFFLLRGGDSVETKYVLAAVQKGTIISSISGSGQVLALQQVDVKPEVSGKLTYTNTKTGQKVYKGQVLAYIDSKDAQKAVRDAEINLESAQIALEKLKNNQQNNVETTNDNLSQAYRDAYNKVSDAFSDLPSFIELSRSILYDSSGISNTCPQNLCAYGNLTSYDFHPEFKAMTNGAENDYKSAKTAFDPNFQTYRNIRLDASNEEIVNILKTTKNTVALLAQAIKSEQNMLDALINDINNTASKQDRKAQIPSQITDYQNNIGATISRLNSINSNLESALRSIDSAKRDIADYELTNPIDLKSQENTVFQRQAALQDAKDNLSNYAIVAPFTGIVAESDIKAGDSVSQSATIATLLTEQSIAEISLNEIDVAKIKVGQKVTVVFDAIEDLTITGEVLEVDFLGAVSQGVVSYGVKVGFDTKDERVKPGMTVSASIITDVKQDVLLVPNSAIKSQNNISFVEMPQNVENNNQFIASLSSATAIVLEGGFEQKIVETGLSNDSNTEIVNGLEEGDIIISRTITDSSNSQNAIQGNSLFPTGGSRSFR